LQGHSEGISDIAWSSEGDLIASASDDKTVRIWDLNLVGFFPANADTTINHLQGTAVKVLKGHTNFVFCVNFNHKSNLLASGGFDETVRIWDVARGPKHFYFEAPSQPL
jgi:COMPASS component SWD3